MTVSRTRCSVDLFGESKCLSCQAQHLSLTSQNDLGNTAESGVFSSHTGPKSVKSVIALRHRGTVISILVRFKLRKQRCFASRRKSVHSSVCEWSLLRKAFPMQFSTPHCCDLSCGPIQFHCVLPLAAAFVSLFIISYVFSPYGSHQIHFALQAAAILDVHVSFEGLGQERPEVQHKL